MLQSMQRNLKCKQVLLDKTQNKISIFRDPLCQTKGLQQRPAFAPRVLFFLVKSNGRFVKHSQAELIPHTVERQEMHVFSEGDTMTDPSPLRTSYRLLDDHCLFVLIFTASFILFSIHLHKFSKFMAYFTLITFQVDCFLMLYKGHLNLMNYLFLNHNAG